MVIANFDCSRGQKAACRPFKLFFCRLRLYCQLYFYKRSDIRAK